MQPPPPAATPVRTWRPAGVDGVVCLDGTTSSYAIEPYDDYVLGVVEAGAMLARRGAAEHRVAGGQVVRWDPSGGHRGRGAGGRPWRARLLVVELPAMRRWALDEEQNELAALAFDTPVLDRPDLAAALGRLHRLLEEPTSELERETTLLVTLGAIARPGADPAPAGREPGVRAAREHLQAHLARNVTLDELAAVAGVGRFRLVRAFTAEVGVPPHRFQLARRLSAARRALEAGEPIADVAWSTGFTDQSHLHRHFRRAFGTTPARYRRAFASR